ncbi:MAG TPA: hypothetical protein VGF91_31485 [Solirubrobacteraceae bacterium]
MSTIDDAGAVAPDLIVPLVWGKIEAHMYGMRGRHAGLSRSNCGSRAAGSDAP